jgi:OmpA-OmpF porin, OOP family
VTAIIAAWLQWYVGEHTPGIRPPAAGPMTTPRTPRALWSKEDQMKTIRIIAASLLLAGAWIASAPAAAQAYLAFGIGQSDYDIGNVIPDLINSSDSFDGKDTGFKIFGGYRFNPYFALEVAYVDLGKATYSGTFVHPVFGPQTVTGGSLETWGVNASAVGILPLSPSFELFGKIGLFGWESKARDTTGGVPFSGEADDADVSFGAGMALNVTRNVSIRVEWERFRAVDNIDLLSLGLAFKF